MARWVVAVVLSGLAYGLQTPSHASEMRFSAIGDALMAQGVISPTSFRQFRAAYDAHPGTTRVVFDSPGGVVTGAVALGVAIREAGLSAHVAPQAQCASACVHALAGGVERSVAPGARVSVHRLHGRDSGGRPVELDPERRSRLLGYLAGFYRDMGVDPALIALGDEVPPDSERALEPSEIRSFRLATR